MRLKTYIAELKRRNVFKAAVAYLVVAWIIVQVASIVLPAFDAPSYFLQTILFILAVGLPVWVIFAWVYEMTPEGLKKTDDVDAAASSAPGTGQRLNRIIIVLLSLAVVLLLVIQFWQPTTEPVNVAEGESLTASVEDAMKSIAVLPFTNMSSDTDQEYFCDGIAEDIINDLMRVEDLHVVARTSSFAFRGKEHDIREIGAKLGAHTIVDGSVRKAGTRLRITAQLINVADGYHLWSERYDRELEDVFAIQNEIANNIVRALQVELSVRDRRALETVRSQDIRAYDYYIKGRSYFHASHYESFKHAIDLFSRAIEIDDSYALAYAGLADSYSHLYMYFERDDANLKKALRASEKALELGPDLAEAHSARGLALAQDGQYDEAEKEFDEAIASNPKLFEAYYQYARICRTRGKHEKAARLFQQAARVDPANYSAALFLVSAYEAMGNTGEMEKANRRALDVVRQHLDMNPDDVRALYLGAAALVREGEAEEAIRWLDRAVSIDPDEIVVLYNAACIYATLGMHDRALDNFERAIETGYASRDWIENDKDLDPIRQHPRFKNAMKKLE